MRIELRPLTTIELLDAAWLLLRRNAAQFYACSGLGTAPVALLVMGYFLWLGRLVEGTENSTFYTGTAIWAVGMAFAWALNSVARGAVTATALADARNEPIPMGQAWQQAWRHAAGSAFVGLAAFSVCGVLYSCLGVPAVFLATVWWVARPALMTEDRPFAAALRRSWRLTEGYRGKAFGLWALIVALFLMAVFNLHLLVQFLTGTFANLLGMDTSGVAGHLQFENQAYTTFLVALAFVHVDPLKTAADVVFYLDLRTRREGADLQERLRAIAGTAAAVLVLALTTVPGRAGTEADYLGKVRALRQQIEAAKTPDNVDPALIGDLRHQLVDVDGQKLTVENPWLRDGMNAWREDGDKATLLRRLEAVERSMGSAGPAAAPRPAGQPQPSAAPAGVDTDPKQALQKLLQEPEFQPLAERSELQDLMKGINLNQTRNWWRSFWDWVMKTLFKPPQPKTPEAPAWRWPDATILVYVILGLLILFLLVLLVRWLMERPVKGDVAQAAVAGAAPPLEASATENALDHSVDEWELFAQQWLQRGEVRQAIRALYLATLVHLHRERRIDYNRAFTNWVYVRHFRGEADQKGVLRTLTQKFDEVWYGEKPVAEPSYREFEQGVRALGTPAPGTARG
jgi:hypothetical protein